MADLNRVERGFDRLAPVYDLIQVERQLGSLLRSALYTRAARPGGSVGITTGRHMESQTMENV